MTQTHKMIRSRHRAVMSVFAVSAAVLANAGHAATTLTWTAANGGAYSTAANWNSGAGPAPASDLISNLVRFDSTVAGVTAGTVTFSSSQSVYGVNLATAGWTLTGAPAYTLGAGGLNSLGTGTNTVNLAVNIPGAGNVTVGDGINADVLKLRAGLINTSSDTITVNTGSTLDLGANGASTIYDLTGLGTVTVDQNATANLQASSAFSGRYLFSGTENVLAAGGLGNGNASFILGSGTLNLSTPGMRVSSLAMSGGTLTSSNGLGGIVIGTGTSNSCYISGGSITGNLAMTWNSNGTLTLNNPATSFTGGLTVNAGIVSFGANGGNVSIGAATNVITLNGGALNPSNTSTILNPIVLGAVGGTIMPTGVPNFSGAISGSGALTLGAPGIGGTVELSGGSSYSGGTTVNTNATLEINGNNALGDPSAGVTFNNRSTLLFAANLGSFSNGGGDISTRPVTFAGNVSVNTNGNNVTLANSIGNNGPGALLKIGTGNLILNGSNTYTGGTTLGVPAVSSPGMLITGNANALGTGLLTIVRAASPVLMLNSATLNLYAGMATNNTSTSGNLPTINSSYSGAAVLIDNVPLGAAPVYTGLIGSASGSASSNIKLVKNGLGTQILGDAGTDYYSGGTDLNAGELGIDTWRQVAALGTGPINFNGGTIRLMHSILENVFNANIPAFYTNWAVGGGFDVDANQFLQVNGTTSGLGINGSGPLAKLGLGTLDFAGNYTAFNGDVTISAGTVSLVSSGGLTFTNTGGLGNGNVNISNSILAFPGLSVVNAGKVMTLNGNATLQTSAAAGTIGGALMVNDPGNLISAGSTVNATGLTTINPGGVLIIAGTFNPNGGVTNNGALQIGNGGTTGTLGGVITNNGSLIFNRSDTITITNALTGNNSTGSVVQDGPGTLILSGPQSYTGGTIVNGGILQFNSGALPPSGNILINAGGALAATGAFSTVSAWVGSNRISTASAGALAIAQTESDNVNLAGYGSLYLGAIGNVSYSGILTPAGNTYYLGGGGGTLTVTSGLADGSPARNVVVSGPGSVVLAGPNTYSAGTAINSGVLQFNNGALPASGSVLINSGGVLAATGAFSSVSAWIGSNSISAASSGTLALAQSESDNANLTGYNSLCLGALGNFTYSGTLTPANNTYLLGGGGGILTMANGLTDGSQPQSLIVSSSATVVLAGSGSYSGGTTLLGNDTLKLANGSALGTGILTFGANPGGATLDLNGVAVTVAGLSYAGQGGAFITSSNGAASLTIAPPSGSTVTMSGETFSDSAASPISLIKDGAGTLIFNSSNVPRGSFTIQNGIVQLGVNLSLNSNLAVSNSTMDLNGHNLTVAGSLSGVGNGYIESTNVSAPSTLNLFTNGTTTFAGTFGDTGAAAGALSLVVGGAGTLVLAGGSDVYTGTTIVNGATLQVGNGTVTPQLGDGNMSLNAGGKLVFDTNDSAFYGGNINGSGSVTLNGTGLYFPYGINSYTGGTIINGGTVDCYSTTSIPAGSSLTLNAGGIVDMYGNSLTFGNLTGNGGAIQNSSSATVTLTIGNGNATGGNFAGAIQNTTSSGGGDVAVTKTGSGLLTLSGSNTYTGATTINAGTLAIAGSLSSTTVTINGGTLASGTNGSIAGPVLAGSGPNTIAPGGAGSIGKLTLTDGLTTSGSAANLTTLAFDLGSGPPVSGIITNGDLLTLSGGTINILPGTALAFSNSTIAPDDYRLIAGTSVSGINIANFSLPAPPSGDSFLLSTTVDPGFIDLAVMTVSNGLLPEPGSVSILGLGTILLARRRRPNHRRP